MDLPGKELLLDAIERELLKQSLKTEETHKPKVVVIVESEKSRMLRELEQAAREGRLPSNLRSAVEGAMERARSVQAMVDRRDATWVEPAKMSDRQQRRAAERKAKKREKRR